MVRTLAALLLMLLLLLQMAEARPSHFLSRPKRVSDQRLAELETIMGLNKMKGKLVTVPIGFGRVDPNKLGRRRRSSTETSLQELRRILRSIAHDEEAALRLTPEERSRYARLFSYWWDENERGDEEQLDNLDRDDNEALY